MRAGRSHKINKRDYEYLMSGDIPMRNADDSSSNVPTSAGAMRNRLKLPCRKFNMVSPCLQYDTNWR